MNSNDIILILDFGSQYTQLIARRVREIGVFSEVKPSSISTKEIIKMNPSGIILSGGPETVTISSSQKVHKSLLEAKGISARRCNEFAEEITPTEKARFFYVFQTIKTNEQYQVHRISLSATG